MTPQQLVDNVKKAPQFKYKYQGWSDLDIYDDIKNQYPDQVFPEYNPPKKKTDSLMDVDTSPGIFEWLGNSLIYNPLTAIGAEAGGVNEDFWKDSYNKSMAGLIYKSIHGEDKYEDVEYDADWKAQAGQFFVGLFSPVELAVFAAAGPAGAKGASYISKLAIGGLKSGVVRKASTEAGISTGKHLLHNMATGAVEMGISGTMFSAAHGAVHSAAEQKETYGSVNSGETIMAGVKAGLESFPLYAATGGIAGGAFKTLHNFASLPKFSNAVFGEKVNKLLTGTVPQVGAEAALFSTLPTVMGMEGAASFGSDEWWGELGKNAIIIGGMRTIMRLRRGKTEEGIEMMKLLDTEMKLQGKSLEKTLDSKKNIKDNISDVVDIVAPQELLKSIIIDEANLAGMNKELGLNKTKSKKLSKLLDKLDDSDYIEKISRGDAETINDVTFLLKEGGLLNLATKKLIENIVEDPSRLQEHFKSQFPDKEANKTNLEVFKINLKNYGKNIDDYFDTLNNAITGDLKAPQGAKVVEEAPLQPTVGLRTKAELSKRTKNQLVTEYNKALDRYINEKFGEVTDKKRDTIRKGFELDTTLGKNVILDELFLLKERVVKLKTGTEAQIGKVKTSESIKLLKDRVEKVETLEKKIGTDPKFWGIGEGRQKKIVEIDKQVNERKPTEKLNASQNKIYNDNKAIIRDMLYNEFMRTKAGKRQTRLSEEAIKTKIELYNKLNDFATSRNKRIFELNDTEFREFMQGKETLEGTALHDLIHSRKSMFTNEIVRNLTAENIQEYIKPAVEITKGFKVDYIIDVATGQARKGADVSVVTGKYGKGKQVPLTQRLKTALVSIFKRNKSNNISYRHKEVKATIDPKTQEYVDLYHEFLFTDVYGKAISKELGGRILSKLYETKTWKDVLGDVKYTQETFRKSFTSHILKVKPELKDIAEAYILGHTTGLTGSYFKFSVSKQKALMKELDKYARILENKTEKKKVVKGIAKGDERHITPHEIRELIKAVNELPVDKNGNIKIGRSVLSKETVKELLMYQAQSGARVSEALPTNKYLSDIGYLEGYKEFIKNKGIQTGPPEGGGTGGTGGAKTKLAPIDFNQSSIKRTKDIINKSFNALFEKTGQTGSGHSKDRKLVKEWIYKSLGFDEKYKFGKETDIAEFTTNAQRIYQQIIELSPDVAKKIVTDKTFMRTYQRIIKPSGVKERMNITDEVQITLLKNLGVKSGNLLDAELHQIQNYESILHQMQTDKIAPQSWLDDAIRQNLSKVEAKKAMNSLLGTKILTMPVHMVLTSIGAGKLSTKLFGHTAAELNYTGKLYEFEYIGRGRFGRKFDKMKEHLWTLDKERFHERLKNGDIKKSELDFIKKAIVDVNAKVWKTKNNSHGEFVENYKTLMKFYKESAIQALKQNMTKAQFERFEKDGHIKWIVESKNIYVSRRLTEEFKKYYDIESNHFEKISRDQTEYVAKKMAIEKYGEKVTKEKYLEFMEEANILATEELHNMFEFNPGKFSSSFMKPRHIKLPEFVKVKVGNTIKKVQVYETSYGETINAYANGMGKFIANLEYFPEYVNLKGFEFGGRLKNIKELNKIDPKIGDWADRMVKRHLGIERPKTDFPVATTTLLKWTSMLAKLQLSFPTSGLKNLIVGNVQTTLAFRPKHFLGGIFDSISTDNRRMVISMSATELGLRHLSPKGIKGGKIVDKFIFKMGGMKLTENLNRYISTLASMREQVELARIVTHSKPTTSKHKKAIIKLKDFYKLTDSEIKLIKKYGTKPDQVDINQFKDKFEGGKVIRQLETVMQKMSTMAHINTQGASIDIFMPAWAENPVAKSALLYKRMAYAASVNTIQNVKLAYNTGSPIQLALFGLSTYFGGETLIYIYEKLLGQTMPTENSPMGKQLMTTLWKGEFMGLASEFLSPYYGRENVMFASRPAIMSSAELLYATLSNIWKKDKYWLEGEPVGIGQQFNELLTGHIGLYNGITKMAEKATNPYYKNSVRFRKMHNEFVKDMNKSKDYVPNTGLFAQFEKAKYMNAFHKMFHAGSEKQFAKWYALAFFSKANDYMMEGRAPGVVHGTTLAIRNQREAFKLAHSEMKKALDRLNPIREMFDLNGNISARRQYRYFQWLARSEYEILKRAKPNVSDKKIWETAFKKSDKVQDLIKLANTYEYKKREFKKNFSTHYKEMNIERLLKQFGINSLI